MTGREIKCWLLNVCVLHKPRAALSFSCLFLQQLTVYSYHNQVSRNIRWGAKTKLARLEQVPSSLVPSAPRLTPETRCPARQDRPSNGSSPLAWLLPLPDWSFIIFLAVFHLESTFAQSTTEGAARCWSRDAVHFVGLVFVDYFAAKLHGHCWREETRVLSLSGKPVPREVCREMPQPV